MGQRYPEQSARQRERAKRYENHNEPHRSPKQVTHGLKPGWARGLTQKSKQR